MTNLGQLGWYLGINFICTIERFFLSQKPYVENMFQMLGMVDYNPTKVPMVENTRFT